MRRNADENLQELARIAATSHDPADVERLTVARLRAGREADIALVDLQGLSRDSLLRVLSILPESTRESMADVITALRRPLSTMNYDEILTLFRIGGHVDIARDWENTISMQAEALSDRERASVVRGTRARFSTIRDLERDARITAANLVSEFLTLTRLFHPESVLETNPFYVRCWAISEEIRAIMTDTLLCSCGHTRPLHRRPGLRCHGTGRQLDPSYGIPAEEPCACEAFTPEE